MAVVSIATYDRTDCEENGIAMHSSSLGRSARTVRPDAASIYASWGAPLRFHIEPSESIERLTAVHRAVRARWGMGATDAVRYHSQFFLRWLAFSHAGANLTDETMVRP